jgi:hypothetical protein
LYWLLDQFQYPGIHTMFEDGGGGTTSVCAGVRKRHKRRSRQALLRTVNGKCHAYRKRSGTGSKLPAQARKASKFRRGEWASRPLIREQLLCDDRVFGSDHLLPLP